MGTKSEITLQHSYYASTKFFSEIHSKYNKAIFFEVLKKTINEDVAEDLCQEIFIKVWKNRDKYQVEKGKIYTWLINIAINHCNDYFRSRYYKNAKITSKMDSSINTVSVNYINTDKITVKQLLSHLEPEQRELIELLFINGLTHIQVSKIKNIPLGTVKTLSRNALIRLKIIAGISLN